MKTLLVFLLTAASCLAQIGPAVFTGTGLNDAASSGAVTGAAGNYTVKVVIDSTGSPDTFNWRVNGGAITANVPMTGAAQVLTNGIAIEFAATTGHTLTDFWTITETTHGSVNASNFLGVGIGAVFRSAESKMRDVLSVTDFGAKCNGTTDDSVAIQNALNAAGALGGAIVDFPPGTCIGLNLSISSNTMVQGHGDASIVKLKSAVVNTSALFLVATSATVPTANNIKFQHLQMDGNASGQTGATDFTSTIIRLVSSGSAAGPAYIAIDHVTMHDAFGHFFLSYLQGSGGPASYVSITNSTMTNAGLDGVYWNDINYLTLTDNTVSNWGLVTGTANPGPNAPDSYDGFGGYSSGHRYAYTICRNRMTTGPSGQKFSIELFSQGVGDDYNDVELGDNHLIGTAGYNGFSVTIFSANIHGNVFTGGGGNNTRSGLWELTLYGGAVTGNVVQNGGLNITPGYSGIAMGDISITGNTIIPGPFSNVNGIMVGSSNGTPTTPTVGVNVTGNIVDMTGTTNCTAIFFGVSDGVRGIVNQGVIAHNQIYDTANTQQCQGVRFDGFDGETGFEIRGNTIYGMATALLNQAAPGGTIGATEITLVGNNLQSNAVVVSNLGTGIIRQWDNITSAGQTNQQLNGAAFVDTVGNIFSPSGSLLPVVFTPTTVGWYRILVDPSATGSLSGLVRVNAPLYDATETDIEFQFAGYAYATLPSQLGSITQTRFLNYNNDGIVDQIRMSNDGAGTIAVDIHIRTATVPKPVTLNFLGLGIPAAAVVLAPVVGATALSGASVILTEPTATGNLGLLTTGPVQVSPFPFANLPACSASTEGGAAAINDSSTLIAGATATGGGGGHVAVYCDGTNWIVTGAASGGGAGVTSIAAQTGAVTISTTNSGTGGPQLSNSASAGVVNFTITEPGAWTAFTPGSITNLTSVTTDSAWLQAGKTVNFRISIQGAVSSSAIVTTFTVPWTAKSNNVAWSGIEILVSASSLTGCSFTASGSTMSTQFGSITSGQVVRYEMSGTVEVN